MYRRRVNVRGIIFKDGKLFAQKQKDKSGVENSYWSTPGGGLDDGEYLLTGLKREMIEETGVVPEIGHLMYVQQFFDGDKEQLELFFHIKNANDYEAIDLDATSHGHVEISECGFIDPREEYILPAMLRSRDIKKDIDLKRPVDVSSELPAR